tara:strand:- start:3445 stop:6282 length:2838 start_codon:yes stop_codon:yes gene_type:complete
VTKGNSDELQVQIQYALIEKLSESQQKMSTLLSLLDECVFECSSDFILTYVNSAWTRQLDYQADELIGISLVQLVPNFNLKEWLQVHTEKNIDQNIPQRVEIQLRNKANVLRWFELRMVKSDQMQMIGSLFDIQDHKEMEARLRQKEEETRKLSLVASHTKNMVVITDSSGCIEWVNSSFEQVTGYNREHVYGLKPGAILQGPETDPDVVATMSQAICAKQAFSVELINYTKMGQPYWVAIDASPVKDELGEIKNFIAIQSDISQRIKAEKVAAEAEHNYRIVVDNISEVVLRLQPDGSILFMNHAWRDLVKRHKNQCLGIAINQFISEVNQVEVAHALANFRQGNRDICCLELQMECGDGTHTWVEMTMTPVEDSQNGQLAAIAATIVNVDDRVCAAQTLQEAKQHAEGLAQERSRFLANISHEIRTPLNAMIGASEILQNTGLNQEQDRFANMIQSSGSALLSILDDVLTYSRFEAGAVTLENRQFDLGVCIDEAVDIVSENALAKKIELILSISAKTPLNIIGDNVRLRQVMINLLANAIKFTAQGHVYIQVDCLTNADNQLILDIAIEDTGIGIAAEKISQLFIPFMQSDISTTRQYGGSGLGLAICQQICDAAGGNISVESKLDVGSTFRFQFPIDSDLKSARNILIKLPQRTDRNIWVVGQAPQLNHAISQALQRYKIPFTQFKSVDEITDDIELIADLIIVTDPAITPLCRKMIENRPKSDLSAFLVSLDVLGNSNCMQTIGSNELLVNGPFKASHFNRIIEQLHEMQGKASIELTKNKSSAFLNEIQFINANILVVEDNPQNQIIMQQFLQLCGCRVILAEHGVEALKKLQTEHVDIVLMDMQMPVMDGMTTTRHIRASDAVFQHVPIISVTADAVYGDKERYLSAGMNDYLAKPVFRAELYALLDKHMPFEKKKTPTTSKIQRLINMRDVINNIKL